MLSYLRIPYRYSCNYYLVDSRSWSSIITINCTLALINVSYLVHDDALFLSPLLYVFDSIKLLFIVLISVDAYICLTRFMINMKRSERSVRITHAISGRSRPYVRNADCTPQHRDADAQFAKMSGTTALDALARHLSIPMITTIRPQRRSYTSTPRRLAHIWDDERDAYWSLSTARSTIRSQRRPDDSTPRRIEYILNIP